MRIASAVVALALLSSAAGAQASASRAVVHVLAADSTGAPVRGAEISVVKNLKDVVARVVTDEAGNAFATVEIKDSTDFEATMRKIGYRRGDRFFAVGPRDTANVNIIVPVPGTQLAAMKVTVKRTVDPLNTYDLDADDIESSDRVMTNGWDVVKMLRPNMLTSRGGCSTGALEVWVNGKRIRLPLPATGVDRARAFTGVPPRTRVSYVPVAVMSDIAPEHIAEIHYKDCFDHSVAAVGSQNAIFVTLKPGVVYLQDVGSFVVDTRP